MRYNTGFSLIEIILALGVSVIVFIGIFHFVTVAFVKRQSFQSSEKFFSYTYGEQYCPQTKNIEDVIFNPVNTISLSPYISTSTRVTSIHYVKDNTLLITTDSASTSEADIFLFDIDLAERTITPRFSVDVGPGIQDSKLLDSILYVANTSVNSHVKVFRVDTRATGTGIFTELSNTKIPTLALSASLPKKITILNQEIILGTEKSNSGGELFVFPILPNGSVLNPSQVIELNGQMNQGIQAYGEVYIVNAADPELRVFDAHLKELFSYDAPLTLGNGKSVLFLNPYTILGRTLGSGELSVLMQEGTSTKVLDIERTYGTVDFLQNFQNGNILTLTAQEDNELQIWNFTQDLKLLKGINLPGRVTSHMCAKQNIFLSILINEQPQLIWLQL